MDRESILRDLRRQALDDRLLDQARDHAASYIAGVRSMRVVPDAAAELVSRGAQGIVLGCTELPLIVKREDLTVARFDTLAVHVEAGVRFLVEA